MIITKFARFKTKINLVLIFFPFLFVISNVNWIVVCVFPTFGSFDFLCIYLFLFFYVLIWLLFLENYICVLCKRKKDMFLKRLKKKIAYKFTE